VNYVIPGDGAWRFDLGGDVITGTGTHTGHWRALQALGTGATLDTGTAATDLGGTVAGVAIPAGTTVHARFTAVQLSSGAAGYLIRRPSREAARATRASLSGMSLI
jgi:hypothetical protein